MPRKRVDQHIRSLRLLTVVLCSGTVFALSAANASGAYIADNGFRPDPNGFSFQNYGSEAPYQNLTVAEMQRLFGDVVCTGTVVVASGDRSRGAHASASSPCNLAPPAKVWMDEENKAMGGGHCEGFAVLSEGLYKHLFSPFGSGSTYSYVIDGNVSLQRSIAYAWTWQDLPAVYNRDIFAPPTEILHKLERVLSPSNRQIYTIEISKLDGSGGHAVTPFAVTRKGHGIYDIEIYDNNYPGVTREIQVDTKADKWSYNAAQNPSDRSELYVGDARSETMDLSPLTPGLGVQPCPFCPRVGAPTRPSYNAIQLNGSLHHHAHLLIRDSRGHEVGVRNGRIIRRFPGAKVIPRHLGDFTKTVEPTYHVPLRGHLGITVDGTQLRHHDREALSVEGPGYDVGLDRLKIGPGQADVLGLGVGARNVTFTSSRTGRTGSPRLTVGLIIGQRTVQLTLELLSFHPGATLHLSVNPRRRRVRFYATGFSGKATYRVTLDRGTQLFNEQIIHKKIRLRGGKVATFRYRR